MELLIKKKAGSFLDIMNTVMADETTK